MNNNNNNDDHRRHRSKKIHQKTLDEIEFSDDEPSVSSATAAPRKQKRPQLELTYTPTSIDITPLMPKKKKRSSSSTTTMDGGGGEQEKHKKKKKTVSSQPIEDIDNDDDDDDIFASRPSTSKPTFATVVTTPPKKRKPTNLDDAKSSAKSDGRKVLEAQWYGAFFPSAVNKPLPQGHSSALIVIADEIQALKGFGSSFNSDPTKPDTFEKTHFEDLCEGMRLSAESTFKNSRTCEIYCCVFDKSRFVPISKGVEQTKRNLKLPTLGSSTVAAAAADEPNDVGHVIPPADGISYKNRRPYISPGQPIPTDWNLAKHDRKDTLQDIIRQLSRGLLNVRWTYEFAPPKLGDEPGAPRRTVATPPRNCYQIPAGKRVIVDGHAMTLQDVLDLGIYMTRKHMLSIVQSTPELLAENGYTTDEHVYETPICFDHVLTADNDDYLACYFMPELRNRVGEADFSIFAIHKQLSQVLYREQLERESVSTAAYQATAALMSQYMPYVPMDILSVDTDLIYLSLLYLDKLRRDRQTNVQHTNCQIWIRYWPSMTWTFSRPGLKAEFIKWCNINELYRLIEVDAVFPPGIEEPNLDEDGEVQTVESVHKKQVAAVAAASVSQSDTTAAAAASAKPKYKRKPKPKMTLDGQLLARYSQNFKSYVSYRCWSIVLTLLAGGGDYTSGYRSVTYEKMFLSIKQNARYIRDLVRPAEIQYTTTTSGGGQQPTSPIAYMIVNGDSYGRLIKCAYMLSKQSLADVDPTTISMQEIFEKTEHLAPQNQPPDVAMITQCRLHLSHYVFMLSQLGSSNIVEQLDFENYGFARADETKPWSSDNILRQLS